MGSNPSTTQSSASVLRSLQHLRSKFSEALQCTSVQDLDKLERKEKKRFVKKKEVKRR
jgi:hypothetical protein